MTVWRNHEGDELTYHDGPLDGQPLNFMAPTGPHDEGYEVRTNKAGTILGAWWIVDPLTRDGEAT